MDYSKYINKDKNEIDKFKLAKNAMSEPVIKYALIGAGIIALVFVAGKIMFVFSHSIKQYKHLRDVIRS